VTDRDPRLDHLVGPRLSASFRERVRDGIHERERLSRRRWRTAALVLLVTTAAGAASTAVLAFNGSTSFTVDRTISCPVAVQGGAPVFNVGASVRTVLYVSGKKEIQPGGLGASAAVVSTKTLWYAQALAGDLAAGADSMKAGYSFDSTICSPASRIPLTGAGLPKPTRLTATPADSASSARCLFFSSIRVRMRVTINHAGVPTAAKFAVRGGKKLRPLAFVDWTPKSATVAFSSACTPK
jgi:hypothetical protein